MTQPERFRQQFEIDVKAGLTAYPKYLYSKYIYDKKGDKLFQDIMAMPEYYLTRTEFDILKTNSTAIINAFTPNGAAFDFIELGAGDGKKTKIILEALSQKQQPFTFIPIDISKNSIDSLSMDLKNLWPDMDVQGEIGMYFKVLERLATYNTRPKVIMMLGSNIGNLLHEKAIEFLRAIKDTMSKDDLLFMGFDQKKDPLTIQTAYADPAGITQEFNRNILQRINKEMGGDFDPEKFTHWEAYDPETGTAKSFLLALEDMTVQIKDLQLKISFKKWETIHTEISQKYDDKTVEWLASASGLTIKNTFTNNESSYKNYLFTIK